MSSHYDDGSEKEVELEIEQEDADGNTKKITYRGPADGLDLITEELETVVDGSTNE